MFSHFLWMLAKVQDWPRSWARSEKLLLILCWVNSWHRTIQLSPVKTFEKPFIWTLYSQPTEIWDDWVVPEHHLTVILKCLHSWSVVLHMSHASLFVVEVPTELTVRSYPTMPCLLHPQALCQWASCYRIVWSVQVVLSLTNYMTWHGVSQNETRSCLTIFDFERQINWYCPSHTRSCAGFS